MKSMTGCWRGECARDGSKVTVEISSVNRKQAEIALGLPRDLEPLEPRLRDEINRCISRGRLNVRVALQTATGRGRGAARFDLDLAKSYGREFTRLAKVLKLSDAVTLDLVARAPGVMQMNEPDLDPEALWPAVDKALRQALSALVKMREREGAHLKKDLQSRIAAISRAVVRVAQRAPESQRRYREQLLERVKAAGLDLPADDERLVKEAVLFADRSNISEELTRLQSHLQQFEDCMQSAEPVGRTLDFLSQEMNREVNTIGSKANDAAISREVVQMKTELEKFREQVQNVE